MIIPSKRRTFLKAGLVASVGLGLVNQLHTSAKAQPANTAELGTFDLKKLKNADAALIAALAPVILAGTLPQAEDARKVAISEVVDAFDRTIAGLSPLVEGEIRELFSLLHFSLTRKYLAGVSKPWDEASSSEIEAFLSNWRNHRFALMQSAYQALARLMIACWYGNPLSWGAIEYSGPPYGKELGL
jgi:hypothetical protein